MCLTDAHYFTRRAFEQLDRATQAHNPDVARTHCELSDLYLSRARDAVGQEFRAAPAVPMLRLSA